MGATWDQLPMDDGLLDEMGVGWRRRRFKELMRERQAASAARLEAMRAADAARLALGTPDPADVFAQLPPDVLELIVGHVAAWWCPPNPRCSTWSCPRATWRTCRASAAHGARL